MIEILASYYAMMTLRYSHYCEVGIGGRDRVPGFSIYVRAVLQPDGGKFSALGRGNVCSCRGEGIRIVQE